MTAVASAAAVAAPSRPAPPVAACGLEDPRVAQAAPPVPRRRGETPGLAASAPPLVRRIAPARRAVGRGAHGGALAGKTVYVSAGHGFTWNATVGAWRTQRGNTHDLVEDLVSAETVDQFLIPYLVNMGAYVVPVREADLNPNRDIVDDATDDGRFVAEGSPAPADDGVGFGVVAEPIAGDVNPFESGRAVALPTTAQETARVTWVLDVPERGEYNVYVAYVQRPDRASDAHYIVRHAGGETHFRVDQRRHGSTWVRLGRFYFDAGVAPNAGSVTLANDSADAGTTVSADAVRIGGGMGTIDRGGGVSGRPMFENAARYYAQLSGAPPSVYDYTTADGNDDVGTRSRFAAWDHEDGEDAVYVAWHTNAPSPARGTSSFAYGPSAYGSVDEFTGVPGSLELMDAIHRELIGDIRAAWDPEWTDRGQHTAYFGEVNPNHNPEMPAALFEVAFHDTAEDADALRDPRFRRLAARAIAQGVARYFAARDGAELVLPPEPPAGVSATQAGGVVTLAWRPPEPDPAGGDPPDAYVVYLSGDGHAFDDGRVVDGERLELTGLSPGEAVYARVTAINAGGESLPSPVVGARVATGPAARVLVVGGFDRLDGAMLVREDLSAYALGTVDRGLLDRINDGSYAARHGAAIAAAGVSFDGADHTAVAAGDVDLGRYDLVDWFVGEESTADVPFDGAERAAIAAFVAGGGGLFVSGSEIGWALEDRGLAPGFVADVLRAAFVADDAGTYGVVAAGEPFDGLAALAFDDRGPGGYDAEFPDVWAPADGSGAVVALRYDGGGGAAIAWRDPTGGARTLTFGFPFETISGESARADVMARALAFFGVDPDPPPIGPDAGAGAGADAGAGGSGGEVTAGCGCRATSGRRPWPASPICVFFAAVWTIRRLSSRPRRSSGRSRRSRRSTRRATSAR